MNMNRKTHEGHVRRARQYPDSHYEPRENELRLISDLSRAREVQQLLQRVAPVVRGADLAARCVPARELGGDFYDFLHYGSGRLAFALADVSGKGTAAALLAALTMGILRAQRADYAPSPAKMLAALNGQIYAAGLDAKFVVMLLAVLDRDTQQLTLANAGNPFPLLLRDGKIQEIAVSGIPLGLVENAGYEAVSLDLHLGDTFVFVSDGILECRDGEQEAFGTGRLRIVLNSLPHDAPAEDISSAILSATDDFSGRTSAPDDDRSLIVLRVTDGSPKPDSLEELLLRNEASAVGARDTTASLELCSECSESLGGK